MSKPFSRRVHRLERLNDPGRPCPLCRHGHAGAWRAVLTEYPGEDPSVAAVAGTARTCRRCRKEIGETVIVRGIDPARL